MQLKAALALALEAVSTNIDLQGSAAPRIFNNRVSDDSSVLASPPDNLSVASVGDIVSLKLISSQVSVNTVSGDMKMLGYFSGRLVIETASGNVVFDTPILSQLHFNPVPGNGRFLTGLRSKGRVKMNSVNGNLRLSLPKTSSAEFKVESFSGDICSAIGKVVKEKYGSGQSLNARLGDGKSPVDLTAM